MAIMSGTTNKGGGRAPLSNIPIAPVELTSGSTDPLDALLQKIDTDNLQAAIQVPVTPQYQKDFQRQLFERLQAVSDPETGIQYVSPARAPFVAGLSAEQQQALQRAQAGLGSYQPFLQQAGATFDQAGGALSTLGDYSDTLARMGGTAAGQVQPFTDLATGAVQRTGADIMGARGAVGGIGQQVAALQDTTGRFDPSDISAFRNPFEDQLVAQIREDIAESTGIQRQRQEQALAASGAAAMGTRADRQRADLSQKALETEIDAITRLRKQGFDDAQARAQQAFESQQARRQQAVQLGLGGLEAGGRLGLSAGQLGIEGGRLGLSAGQLGLSGTELGANILGAGAGLLSDQATQLRGLGGLRADLAGAQQQAQLQDINTLLSLGGLTQGQQQTMLEAQFQDAVAQQMDPYRAIQLQSDIFAGIPSSQSALSLAPGPVAPPPQSPDRLGQLAGLGIAGLGAYKSIFGPA